MDEYAGKVYYVEIDIQAYPDMAEAAGVNGTPTFQIFKDKDVVQMVSGVKQKREYRELINSQL